MKASDVRNLSADEMARKADDLKQELFNLRFQHGLGQLENSQKLKSVKRDLARVKTIIRESELNQESKKD
jgi:large subunit ribosomal protein L29